MKRACLVLLIFLKTAYAYAQSDIITYTEKSKLEWADFKELNEHKDSSVPYNFSASIQMKTIKTNVWNGVATFEAQGIFYPGRSWVTAALKNDQLLEYFQLQYNISNYVGKQLEADINSKKINGAYKNKMDKVFKEYESRLNRVLQQMDLDTDYGKNVDAITKWKAKLDSSTLES